MWKGGLIMKKIVIVFLLSACLLFNISKMTYAVPSNVFKEGVYKVSDFNLSPENMYYVQNTSQDKSVFIMVFDGNKLQLQTIRLQPNSRKYNLLPLEETYRLIIIGEGQVYIS